MGMIKHFLLAAVIVLVPTWSFAWGPAGHRIVGSIAEQHLTPEAAAAVAEILGDKTLSDVATWADEVRDDRPETGPWHYLNPPAGIRKVTMRHSPPEGSVLSCLVEQSQLLRDRRATAVQKAEALRFVVHMVGDIHQPMHVSRSADRGGNDIDVTFKDQETNLHRAWDSGIMNLRDHSWPDMAQVLNDEITDEQVHEWSRGLRPTQWATETFELAMGFAYKIPESGELDDAYLDQVQNIIDERLSSAGIRLAALLNAAFK